MVKRGDVVVQNPLGAVFTGGSHVREQHEVTAGKQFEVIFENDDGMPHNFAIVPPGKHMEIGMAAMTMTPDNLDKQGRAYLPAAFEK
ncbi:MAG: hypothetical protein ABL974_05575 [Prosthecobacter sp.]